MVNKIKNNALVDVGARVTDALPIRIKRIGRLLQHTVQRWQRADASRMAAALSYYAIFSLAPIMLIVISVASLLFERSTVRAQFLNSLQSVLGTNVTQLIRTVLTNMLNSIQMDGSRGLIASGIGVAVMLFGATALFSQLEDMLNRIWETNTGSPKVAPIAGYVRQRLFSFFIVLVTGLLLLFSLLTTTLVSALEQIWPTALPGQAILRYLPWLNSFGSLLVLILFCAILFRFLPHHAVAWRAIWTGAVITGLFFAAGKMGIERYLSHSALASQYGAASSLVVLLIWIYYSSQILLFGAALTREYADQLSGQKSNSGTTDSNQKSHSAIAAEKIGDTNSTTAAQRYS